MKRRQFLAMSLAAGASLPAKLHAAEKSTAGPLYVPPEEARHELTFMQWPTNRTVHPDPDFLALLQTTIARIANAIAAFEPVVMLAASDHHVAVRNRLDPAIALWNIPTDDLWCRDSGPLFARDRDGGLAVSHIAFNGWGGKQVHSRDGLIARRVAARLGVPVVDSGLTGEAGGVEHDGHGRLMAHESSWVIDNRNPGLSRETIEQRLLVAYGATSMIWSPGVRGHDITDYHIDSLARFTGPGRALINLPKRPDRSDPFHNAALETERRLRAAGFELEVIPEPERRRVLSRDFVASYVNFYVCNGAVVAPQFGDGETDAAAIDALKRHYPDREVVTLQVDALGEIGGGIHCATQQMPQLTA